MPVHTCETAETWAGDGTDEDIRLQAECFACQADRARARAISRWEDRPLDPEEDLGWLEDYPGELDHLREEQADIRAMPVYRVADLIGGEARTECLRAIRDGDCELDDVFAYYCCECEGEDVEVVGPRGDHHKVTLWDTDVHGEWLDWRVRLARRCRWCVLREALERARWADTACEGGRVHASELHRRYARSQPVLTKPAAKGMRDAVLRADEGGRFGLLCWFATRLVLAHWGGHLPEADARKVLTDTARRAGLAESAGIVAEIAECSAHHDSVMWLHDTEDRDRRAAG